MNAVLIPFFLGAQMTADEDWQFGPEYVFHVVVNGTAYPRLCSEPMSSVRMCTRLVCQPRGLDTLSCRLNGTRTELFLADRGAPEIPMEQVYYMEDYTIGVGRFELLFAETGLDGIRANRDVHKRELDVVRDLVGPLNVGTRLLDRRELEFRAIEASDGGQCETNFVLARRPDANDANHDDEDPSSFRLIPRFATIDDEVVEIARSRDLEKCTESFPHYFGSCVACHLNDDAVVDIRTSESRTTISPKEFISITTRLITMTSNSQPARWNRLCEEVSLRLEAIRPASSAPPEVEAPMTADIFTTRWFIENDEAEENRNDV